ncbi:TlyA family RNA methyltransferase [TM7 phylum sp. oral taxon 353]|nr:TlyA family RNA methyltransferase [TM7 phylum sp. oral taxon 353]
MKQRLDKLMLARGLVGSRSEAENWIRLGRVRVGGQTAAKPGLFVDESAPIELAVSERYVSRAGLKLAGAAKAFNLDFHGKTVLDIGSSTGGFTDFALQHGAKKVYAVDVGTDQLHPNLRGNKRIELYEKTDIRDFMPNQPVDVVVGDVSFISLREILPHVAKNIMQPETILVAMVKPQFEAGKHQVNKGVIKNDKVRRQILADFENWAKQYFVVLDKKDSDVAGAKGNVERFYKTRLAKY